jgi:hypothetical protein
VLAALLPGCAKQPGQDDRQVALGFVQSTGIGSNLTSLSHAVGVRTDAYRLVSARLGTERALAMLSANIAAATPAYQAQWNEQLAASYLERFSAAELESLRRERSSSPHLAKLEREQAAVGRIMQARTQAMLTQMLTQVMAAFVEQAQGELRGAARS